MLDLTDAILDATQVTKPRRRIVVRPSAFGVAFDLSRARYLAGRKDFHADLRFLDECIEAGVLTLSHTPGEPALGVPAQIAQFWDHPDPQPAVEALMDRARDMNQDCSYSRFDLARTREFIGDHFGVWVLAAFDACPHISSKSDMFRMCWLYVSGGIYLDADEVCISPFREFLSPGADVTITHTPGDPSCLNTWLFACQPRSRLILSMLVLSVATIDRMMATRATVNAWILAGPGALTMTVLDDIARNGRLTVARDLCVLSDQAFRRHIHNAYDLEYKADPIGNWRL